jgi:hypothetical protein
VLVLRLQPVLLLEFGDVAQPDPQLLLGTRKEHLRLRLVTPNLLHLPPEVAGFLQLLLVGGQKCLPMVPVPRKSPNSGEILKSLGSLDERKQYLGKSVNCLKRVPVVIAKEMVLEVIAIGMAFVEIATEMVQFVVLLEKGMSVVRNGEAEMDRGVEIEKLPEAIVIPVPVGELQEVNDPNAVMEVSDLSVEIVALAEASVEITATLTVVIAIEKVVAVVDSRTAAEKIVISVRKEENPVHLIVRTVISVEARAAAVPPGILEVKAVASEGSVPKGRVAVTSVVPVGEREVIVGVIVQPGKVGIGITGTLETLKPLRTIGGNKTFFFKMQCLNVNLQI